VLLGQHPLLFRPGPATGPAWLRPAAPQQNWGGTRSKAVAGSGEQWRSEVGPWVGEMAGEVGDPFGAAGRGALTSEPSWRQRRSAGGEMVSMGQK
jgi:hypothetical protein